MTNLLLGIVALCLVTPVAKPMPTTIVYMSYEATPNRGFGCAPLFVLLMVLLLIGLMVVRV